MDLHEHSFLSIFGIDAAQRIVAGATVLVLSEGQRIFREGDPSDALYLVLEGKVELSSGEHGYLEFIAEPGPDEYFGEFGVLDGQSRSVGATARGRVRLARIPREVLLKELGGPEGSPAFRLMVQTVRKMRRSNRRHVDELLQQEKMSLLGQLVLGVVHDFRSPLSVVLMATELLESGADDPAVVKESRELIASQVQHVNAMAEEVLDYSRGRTNIRREPVELSALLQRFVDINERFMRTRGVRLALRCEGQCVLRADAGRLHRVLQNLVFNAANAMGEKGGSIAVFLEAATRDSVRILVRDNGPGIPEDIRSRVFEPFMTKGSKKGLGLGLAIARQFVEAHGGELTFASETGRGTVFCIKLPVE